ncbi:HNH endonuclease [Sodalis sp. RH14]|uniref:HNH endonuclease n=1 Tax=Sodalis sp. RH14 TaxID=3394329 RepID=UPI0039B6DF17
MIFNKVEYNEQLMSKVSEFERLPKKEKIGGYWDRQDDNELKNLKKHIKDHYIIAQDYTCPYCQQKIVVDHNMAWDIEHIIPKSTHPSFLFKPLNLCIACKDCNTEKDNKNVLVNATRKTLPIKSEDYIISHPHLDNYDSDIKVIEESLYFLPKTDKGRKTIEICGLLRFIYKYSNYGNVQQSIKEGILAYTQALLNTSNPIEENLYLSFIEDLTLQGKKLSKLEFQRNFHK